jgi:D-alanyl-D-alanine carboxypeptidase
VAAVVGAVMFVNQPGPPVEGVGAATASTSARTAVRATPSPRRSASDLSGDGNAGGLILASEPPAAGAPRQPTRTDALPPCEIGDVVVADPSAWSTVLIDTTFRLPDAYAPDDLVPLEQAGLSGGRVRALVIDDLAAMVEAARTESVRFAVVSGYRSAARQSSVHATAVNQMGEAAARRSSARAGHSEHQLGTAIDLRAAGGPAPWSIDFGATRAGSWLAAHSWQYGWIVSYPPDSFDVSCYESEPWHLRYVGRDVAAAIHESGLTPREWLWRFGS